MSDSNIEVLKKETYLKVIENSIGSKLFNSLIVRLKDSGKTVDVLNDGEYSCAFFVSSVLALMQIINKPYSTVKTLIESIESDDSWKKVDGDNVESGDVVFYKKVKFDDGSENAHVGFVLNKEEAVSTDYKNKMVNKHSINDRPIEVIYRYSW